uniref:Protein fem-1 homolog B n=1 Tax=Strigamia maritima TaxID=126957 RepID=T1JE69_STRMM
MDFDSLLHRSSSQTTTETTSESLKQRVYFAARDGMAITLFALLADKPDHEIAYLLSHVTDEEGQKCSPLIISARNGHEKVVKMLLTKFQPIIEQEGTVRFDGYVIEGASPLWCAAGAGHLNVVKYLVKNGANINHPTKTNSTPLRAACFDGRLDIVRYLVEYNADIHIANKYNNTCLMIAAFKGHTQVVSYLLEKGANPNTKAHCGATALHFAAECGHVEIVRDLLEKGANMPRNEYGMTPLVSAAERTQADVVEFLVSRDKVSHEERIDALELLGASFANDKENYNLAKAYTYLRRGMEMRFQFGWGPVLKPTCPYVEAYENHTECRTVEELEAISANDNKLHMESLVIRERILGSHNPEVPHPVIFRGAVFADCCKFDRCIELWMHALRLRQNSRLSVAKDLLRFVQVFCQMIHVGVDLPFEFLSEVLERGVLELERNQIKLPTIYDSEKETLRDEMDGNILTILYLLILVTKLVKKASKQEETHIYKLVYKLNSLYLATKDHEYSLLHLIAHSDTVVDDFHTNDVCNFPCAATAKLLIKCGADVNALDKDRNTPLHLIVTYQKPITDFLTLHSIIMALIEGGAHMDTVNYKGQTPFEAATTGVAEIILRTQSKLSLKCIAAKAVRKFNVSYQGQVPQTLESFIELHGVPRLSYE